CIGRLVVAETCVRKGPGWNGCSPSGAGCGQRRRQARCLVVVR
ncbi:MAG: hypothetical protein AVDCRST_MAG29-1590, partial [uncultured Nocardioidaceae bacterium]